MIVSKNRIKQFAKMDELGHPHLCRICGKPILEKTVNDEEFEYVKTARGNKFYIHSDCARKIINKGED